MTIRNAVTTLVLVAVGVGRAVNADAQSAGDVSRALQTATGIESRLGDARNNLHQMSRALDGNEFEAADGIAAGSGEFLRILRRSAG
jgi:hypothetical protein